MEKRQKVFLLSIKNSLKGGLSLFDDRGSPLISTPHRHRIKSLTAIKTHFHCVIGCNAFGAAADALAFIAQQMSEN
jgi:hypothetical protein